MMIDSGRWKRWIVIGALVVLTASASCTGDDPATCVGDDCTPAPSSCDDGVQGESETDVDCGGECRLCPGARQCATANDCASGICDADNRCHALDVSFAEAVMYPSMYKPYAVASHDFDVDGDIDLAVVNEGSSTIALFTNGGAGAFEQMPSPTSMGFPTGDYPTGVAVADFNRDGVADLVTADYHGDSVSILLGAGSGATYTLTEKATYPTVAGAETSNLAVGDLNGDMIPDVIATNPQSASMSVFLGRANGTLQAGTHVTLAMPGMTSPSQPYSVAIGDFDGDGHNDAAVADDRSSTVFIQLGNGDGTFEPGPAQPALMGIGSFILIARDLDLDGALDLAVANRNSDDVSVLLGDGAGGFASTIVSPTGADTGPYSIAVADFNADGFPDVITANYKSDNASVLLGLGTGGFEDPLITGTTGENTYGIAAGDFNGDGKVDFAAANAISNTMAVKLSTAQ